MDPRGNKNRKNSKSIRIGIALIIAILAVSMTLFGCSSDENGSWTGDDEYSYDDDRSYDPDKEDEAVSSDVMRNNPLEADDTSDKAAANGHKKQPSQKAEGSAKTGKANQKSRYKRAKKKLAKLKWKGHPYRIVNKNKPFFTKKMLRKARKNYRKFGSLDRRWRCTWARASLSRGTMPKEDEERKDISSVHPSGWQSGQSWERMHLIGWALSGENANDRNLITGTHYCNVTGMLPFENRINSYMRSTSNHVLYRVTPIFRGKELVARGVLMEAESVEDKGRGICFNVYCYNVRDDGSKINYNTGYIKETSTEGDTSRSNKERKYVLNMNSGKFHFPSCMGAKQIADHNRRVVRATRKELMKRGYSPCGLCEP